MRQLLSCVRDVEVERAFKDTITCQGALLVSLVVGGSHESIKKLAWKHLLLAPEGFVGWLVSQRI